jgi:hypothetical protein
MYYKWFKTSFSGFSREFPPERASLQVFVLYLHHHQEFSGSFKASFGGRPFKVKMMLN